MTKTTAECQENERLKKGGMLRNRNRRGLESTVIEVN